MELGSSKLVASLGPPGMSQRMGKELFDYPTNLVALPGTSRSFGQESTEYKTQQMIGQLSKFLQAPKSHHQLHDTVWCMRAIGNLYSELLITLRTVILKHSMGWMGSNAQAMSEYHKKELGHILRTMAGHQKDFLFTNYTYLNAATCPRRWAA